HFPSSTPRPPPSTLFPYTTLFRSRVRRVDPGRVEYEVEISFHTRSQLHDVTELVKTEDVLTHRPYRAALIRRGGRRIGDEDPHRSEEHTSELQSRGHLVCRLLLEK